MANPMPRVDVHINQLGLPRFISTLDQTKGYWQVVLAMEVQPNTAFTTAHDHWQYIPCSLHGATATFRHLMDVVLWSHWPYAAAYLDNVIIHSASWHLFHLGQVLMELRWGGLMTKCLLGLTKAKYPRVSGLPDWGGGGVTTTRK